MRQRGKSWYAYWDMIQDGVRKQHTKNFKRDKRACEDFVLLRNADRILGVPEPSNQTFRKFWATYETERLPKFTPKVQEPRRGYQSHARG